MHNITLGSLVYGFATLICHHLAAQDFASDFQTREALDRAITFFHDNCSKHGGYVWRVSLDFTLSEGEAETGPDTIWVQPPATPAVGMAFLRAYRVTGERRYLDYAVETAEALLPGQLQSGGWYYSVHFDPETRREWGYRDNVAFRARHDRRNSTNITTLDDDTTPAALRLIAQVDGELNLEHEAMHEAALFAMEALLQAQHPNGGWSQNWSIYPEGTTEQTHPVIAASYPEEWSRVWLNDWTGEYYLNDNVAGRMIETWLVMYDVYHDPRHLEAAKRTGDFLLLAQMPDPQPAWAQQYNEAMHPVWDRKFEPPAISGFESQMALESLLLLARRTGDRRYLEPIPRAIEYLRSSQLPDGRLARFYELETNRPLYFTEEYELTYSADDVPDHYGFIVDSRLDEIESAYQQILARLEAEAADIAQAPELTPEESIEQFTRVAQAATAAIGALDDRGAWVDARGMRGFNKASPEGVYQSETFVSNIGILCDYLETITR